MGERTGEYECEEHRTRGADQAHPVADLRCLVFLSAEIEEEAKGTHRLCAPSKHSRRVLEFVIIRALNTGLAHTVSVSVALGIRTMIEIVRP